MKTLIKKLLIFFAVFILSACSNTDDSDIKRDNEPNIGLVSLTINGSGLNNLNVEIVRENIEDIGGSIRLSARNNDGYRLTFKLPAPIEKKQYTMIAYNNTMNNISSVTVPSSGIFLSKAGGTLDITEIIENEDCTTYKGSLNIDYRRQDNASGEVNAQGSFEMPTLQCD